MKKSIFLILSEVFFVFIFSFPCFATTWIIDNGAIETSDNTSWDGTNGHSYTTNTIPSGGVGYSSLSAWYSAFLSSGKAGDTIYLREGTYSEDYGSTPSTAMPLPWTVDGTSFETAGRILFSSYPGEWAVIDGNGADSCVIGRHGQGDTQATADDAVPEYWVIERLEITGSKNTVNGNGLGIHGGPWKVRYCYIHDNPGSQAENPGGIRGYCWRNGSIVEYCYFYKNTNADGWNCGHIVIFSDYSYNDDTTPKNNFVKGESREGYIIRYNYFNGSYTGVKEKAVQLLKTSDSDYTYEDYHADIHHNIFVNLNLGIDGDSDFNQVHNNIFDSCNVQLTLNRGGVTDADVAPLDRVVYNNTVIKAPISFGIGYGEDPGTNKDFKSFAYNNIVTGYGSDSYQPSIGMQTEACYGGNCDSSISSCTPNWTTSKIDRNLIHNPQYSDHIAEPYSRGVSSRWYTVAEFNSYQSVTNYSNASVGLFLGESGANQYITDGSFVLTGSTTIANGGINAAHPYLSGVSLPRYVGATNPSDHDWVYGVLNDLSSTLWLRMQGSDDPSWIEGSGQISVFPPSKVQNVKLTLTTQQ